MTWDKAGQRWKKWYKGRPFYGKRGVKKTDEDAYQRAVEEFERWRAETDAETDANKPYRKEYEAAVKLRQEIVDWLRLEGLEERPQKKSLFMISWSTEIGKLNSDFGRLTPPRQPRRIPCVQKGVR